MSATFESIMRQNLKDLSVDKKGQFRGYCATQEDIERLLTQLKCIGYSYSVRSSTHNLKHSDAARSCQRFFFSLMKGNVTIRFFGSAFSVESGRHRECVFGPNYREKKEIAISDNLADHVMPKRERVCIVDTRKSGCPATFSVKCIRVYPGYSVESGSAHPEIKKKVFERLKNDLGSSNKPKSFLRFHVVASPPSHHTHSTESVKVSGDLHPMIVNEIMSIVKNGITSVKLIKLHLENFVETNLNATVMPDRDNAIFYPTNKIIYSHVYQAILKTKKKTIDDDTLHYQISEGQKESTSGKNYSQPCLEVETSSSNSALCQQARDICENLINLTYICDTETIKKLIDDLKVVQYNMELSNSTHYGFPLAMASTSEQ